MELFETKWLYMLLNLTTLAIPLIRSFEPRIHYYTHFKALFAAIAITGVLFVVWDIQFAINGVWGFDRNYLSGWFIMHLPIEEWLFFIIIPYACIFIYEVLNYFVKTDYLGKIAMPLTLMLAMALLTLAGIHAEKAYTALNFLLCGFLLLLHYFVFKPQWLGRFYLAFIIGLLGFFYVNSFLTGSFTQAPVVWYNPEEFMGIRLGTIPVEDTFYGLLLLLLNVTLYEHFKKVWG